MSSSSQELLNQPEKWSASFPKTQAATRVFTYVFKDDSNVETLLTFIKKISPRL